jgi:pyridoxamine 5'-phosphate oxidase
MSISDIRKEYMRESLSEGDVELNPYLQFGRWWREALGAEIEEVNAMTLATASADGKPSARIVLLKGYDEHGFVFFTNYTSRKGQDMAENDQVTLLFFWKELERQVRIEGRVEKLGVEENDAYFQSRPEGSRIGAWASPQSQVIPDRAFLDEQVRLYSGQFSEGTIPRPSHWGGYRVKPVLLEFWQGRPSRLHDRIRYIGEEGSWRIERLAP